MPSLRLSPCAQFLSSQKDSLGSNIFHKMIRELALLGLVSFTAIMFANTPTVGNGLKAGSQWRFLMLEIAHIMIFVMALFFCIMISIIYRMVKAIEREWYRIEDPHGNVYAVDYDPWAAPQEVLTTLNLALAKDSADRDATSSSPSRETSLSAEASVGVVRETSTVRSMRRQASIKIALPAIQLKMEVAQARRAASHYVLCFQFKRAHRLLTVKSFVYAQYLQKKLHKHIIAILEPSHFTWLILGAFGLFLFLFDAFYPAGWHFSEQDSDPGYVDPDTNLAVRPQYVHFWAHLVWVIANWVVAILSIVLRRIAQRMYRERVEGVYTPFSDAWVQFYEDRCPATAAAVRRLPVNERYLYYMLYGFIATRGHGPSGTTEEEHEREIKEKATKDAEEDPRSLNEASLASRGAYSRRSVSDVSMGEQSSATAVRPERSTNWMRGEPSKWMRGLKGISKSHSGVKHHHSAHGHGGHEAVHPVLRMLEVVLSVTAFLVSFAFLFWASEMRYVGYAAIAAFRSRGNDQMGNRGYYECEDDGSGSSIERDIWAPCPGDSGDLAVIVCAPLAEFCLVIWAWLVVGFSTLRIIKYFAVASAVEQIDNNIIGDIEQEKEKEGDFFAAMVMQENHLNRTVLDVSSISKVKERVNSQLRLAELTWRHRQIHEGEDILQKTNKLLDEVESGIRRFFVHYDETHPKKSMRRSSESSGISGSESSERSRFEGAYPSSGSESSRITKIHHDVGPAAWAYRDSHHDMREMVGRLKQYHAVVRMIHNPATVDEHALILSNLNEALLIFDSTNSHSMRCDCLNSLGTLKQKRKQFADATEYFKRALSLRRDKLPSDKAGLAQAHLSLARLLVVDQPPADKQDERCNEALPLLEAALEQYLAAFHAQHPKVGWAHQGIAECMMKLGKLEKAQEHLDIALTISKTSPSRVTELQALGERVEQERAQKKALMRGASSKGLGSMWKKSAAKVLRAGSSSRNLFAPSAASPEGSQPPSPSSGFFRVVRLACATKWDSTSSGLGSPAAAGPPAATKSAKFGDQLQAAAAAARVNTTSASAAEEGRSESSKSLSEVAVEMPPPNAAGR